jgi:hypothetical protein
MSGPAGVPNDPPNNTPDAAPAPAGAPVGAPVSRRRVLQVLGLAAGGAAAGAGAACKPETPARPAGAAGTAGTGTAAARPAFFTPHERRTVDVLADYVIPRDARSGGATDAGVPAWMDAFLADPDTEDATRERMRGGLAWLDAEVGRRFADGAPAAVAGAAVRPAANTQGAAGQGATGQSAAGAANPDTAGRQAAAQGVAQGAGPRGTAAGSDPARGATPGAAPAAQTSTPLTFVGATDAQRRQVLDDIAYPARAPKGLGHGVAFFTMFRDMTASGFFSSRVGHEDLRYQGNVAVPVWDGCPSEATARLGVSYDLMATRVAPRPGPQRA